MQHAGHDFQSSLRPSAAHAVQSPRWVHLVGVAGTGMKAMAEYLSGAGWAISGSDQCLDSVSAIGRAAGWRLHNGHDARAIPSEAELLVFSSAIPHSNPELSFAREHGLRCVSYAEMLGELMRSRIGLSVSGTHGKSTTTAMVSSILDAERLDAGVFIGAEVRGQGWNGRYGTGPHLLVESCEYQRNFLQLTPKHLAVLNIEGDHFDCFADVDAAFDAYAELVARLPADGSLVIDDENPRLRELAKWTSAEVVRVSSGPRTEWCFRQVVLRGLGMQFDLYFRGQLLTRVGLPIVGRHHVLNAAIAAALAHRCGCNRSSIRDGLAHFPGLRRRFEVLGRRYGVTFIDDYAHHPTAVTATLETVRQVFPGRRICCVFQPHQVLRTRVLFREFVDALRGADEIVLVPVYAARELGTGESAEVSRELVDALLAAGSSAQYVESLDQVLATIDDIARVGDIVISMGAGDIDRIHHEFARRIW